MTRINSDFPGHDDSGALDTTLDGLGTLEWLEQELRAKSEQHSKPAQPVVEESSAIVEEPAVTIEEPVSLELEMPQEQVPAMENSARHLVFALQAGRYALPLTHVVEVGRAPKTVPAAGSPPWLLGHSKFHAGDIAVVDMSRFLELGSSESKAAAFLVVRSMKESVQIGLLVDEVCEIAALPGMPQAAGNTAHAFLRETPHGSQSLTVMDAEQFLLSPSLRPYLTPAGRSQAKLPRPEIEPASIEQRVGNCSRQLRRTTERAQEMMAMVRGVHDMVEQARILAMNASIKAAASPDSGDFGAIAGEFARVADRCLHSTRQLQAVAQSMEEETGAAALELESTAGDIAALMQSASRAGARLSEIEGASSAVLSLIRRIAQAAEAQARSSGAVAKAMDEMLSGLREIERTAAEADQAAGSFAKLAGDMRSALRNGHAGE